MRVIAGESRGLRLNSPKSDQVRPTSDMHREMVFNVIADRVRGSRFLDLFAGTGAVGIEALSRGAECCVFIDNSREAAETVKKNVALAGYGMKSRVIRADFINAVDMLARERERFDIVFMDPPYGRGMDERCVPLIESGSLLCPGGLIITERASREGTPSYAGFEIVKAKEYKTASFFFIKKADW